MVIDLMTELVEIAVVVDIQNVYTPHLFDIPRDQQKGFVSKICHLLLHFPFGFL